MFSLTSSEGWHSANNLIVSNCDCVHIPSSENVAGDLTTDPQLYFDSLSAANQDKYFTKAGAQAIRDGADMNQVVNARRLGSMYQANGQTFTREGTTTRGFAGKRLIGQGGGTQRLPGARLSSATAPRLAPESIYTQAANRGEAIDLLRRNGYLL